ncbi:hypothetical protein [Parasitella parasitica]|uniref:Uncharacterized protein n=1 Tax=Parasitella parasitica TaxID=35722 RepID=A0A0B7NTL2_9FUNG|nr:hypothetical protein [Parasitella parasitica]
MHFKTFDLSAFAIIGIILVQCCLGLGLYGGRTLSTKSRNLYSTSPNAVKSEENLPQEYGPFVMEMPLDHFSSNDPNITFKNRYWVNTDYYKPNGPIFFTNAGEAAVDDASYAIFNSTIAQLAQRLGGIFIYMEHRFYGSSGPDALADMAYLLNNIKFSSKLNVPPVPNTKVIVYGCSYSGSLAAWMKEKYSDIVFASVASSAPVQAQFNFYQYFDPIIRYAPASCINSIRNVISNIDSILFGNNTNQVNALKKLFNAEELYDDDFASLLSNPLSEYWQYGITSDKNNFEDVICNVVFDPTSNSTSEQDLLAFAAFVKSFTSTTLCPDNQTLSSCIGSHNVTDIEIQKQKDPSTMSWLWQTCLQFGYFQVSAPHGEPTIVSRKLTTDLFERICQLYFPEMNVPQQPGVNQVNKEYQGWNINLENTLWIDGEWDSWRELSVHSSQINRQVQNSIIIPHATHCANFAGVDEGSPQYMIDIQDQQYNQLKSWLKD